MAEKKRNIRIDQDGTRYAPVPMWRELPQITVLLEEGNTTYRFTGSFDGEPEDASWPEIFSYEKQGVIYVALPIPKDLGNYVIIHYSPDNK